MHRHLFITYNSTVGIDFIGPDPSVLTFTAGQSEGDIQCAEVSILDDSVLDGERNFSIRLVETSGGDGGGGGVQIDVNVPSIDIRIGQDLDDRKSYSFWLLISIRKH